MIRSVMRTYCNSQEPELLRASLSVAFKASVAFVCGPGGGAQPSSPWPVNEQLCLLSSSSLFTTHTSVTFLHFILLLMHLETSRLIRELRRKKDAVFFCYFVDRSSGYFYYNRERNYAVFCSLWT
jgi:hypothetical protein